MVFHCDIALKTQGLPSLSLALSLVLSLSLPREVYRWASISRNRSSFPGSRTRHVKTAFAISRLPVSDPTVANSRQHLGFAVFNNRSSFISVFIQLKSIAKCFTGHHRTWHYLIFGSTSFKCLMDRIPDVKWQIDIHRCFGFIMPQKTFVYAA